MDGRKNNKGHKGKAGRKSKSEEMQLIEQLNKHIDNDEVIKVLRDKINDGDFKALQLYMNYYYGKPKETKDVTLTGDLPIYEL